MESQKLVSRLDAFVSCLFSRQRISAVVPFQLGSVGPGYKKISYNLQVLNPIQDAGSWSHELILVSKIPLHKEHWPLKLVASKAGTINVLGLCCRFLKFRRRCFCWWVVAVVLLFGCDCCCFFGGCLLSLSIVFVLIVFVVLLKYCYCYSCYCCSGRRRHSIQCPRLIWWSGCWNPNVPHRRGGREGRGSRRFFKVLFPPLVTVASEGYSY